MVLPFLTAALPLAASGLQIGGSLMSMFGGGNRGAQDLANRQYELSVRQMQNQAALVAEAMRRSTAGTSDSEGNKTSYDPGSNTWNSSLGPGAERVQRSSDNAVTLRNTVDVPNAQRANEQSHLLSAIAKRSAIPAQAALSNFQPRTAEREFADTQLLVQGANNNAVRPVLQDTLRAFARTGTSAGPVIDAMGRSSAENLRKGTLEARSAAGAGASNTNQAMLAALSGKLGALQSGGQAQMEYPNASVQNPNAALIASIGQRAGGAADAAGKGAAYSAYGTSGTNAAMEALLKQQGPNQLPGSIALLSKQFNPMLDAIKQFGNWYNSPGSQGDKPSTPANIFAGTNLYSAF